MAGKKGGLGRGLDALFADIPVNVSQDEDRTEVKTKEKTVTAGDYVSYLPIHEIMPNINQPRKTFDEEKIEEMAESIKEHGIIQPIVVRAKQKGYEIVAGERRWRGAMKAGLAQVPCLIRELTDEQNMLIAIIENMQREDLNPVEEAEGLYQMIETFGMTQAQVSKSVGKSRPYIANALRLLKLPEYIKTKLADGEITTGHARTLIAVDNEKIQKEICDKVIKENMSVRETEKLVAAIGKPTVKKPLKRVKNPNTLKVEEELKCILGTRVNILQQGKKSKIEIECYNKEEMDRLIELLKRLG